MPPPFQRLTIEQFAGVLAAFEFRRRITCVHMHHTWRPNRAMWRGHDSMIGMWRFHTEERGFVDIAQHLTIDPDGHVWTGRNWNLPPASAVGHNGNATAGPFMFETVGDFDTGRDVLQGAQRKAVLDVTALVQSRFGLSSESLMFHNHMADKSCPGSTIAYDTFLAELRAHAVATAAAPRGRAGASARQPLPLPDSALADGALVQRTLRLIEPDPLAARSTAATMQEELDYDHETEAAILGGPRGGGSGSAPTPEQIDALRPYVLNLRMGGFSNNGLMTSSAADVDMIVNEHLKREVDAAQGVPLRIVLFAHGGLVKESRGLAIAHDQVAWWRDNGVYPIHFIWETGLFETIKDLLERARSPLRQRGLGDLITDRITDPLIESAVRALQSERIWGAMKSSAQLASADGGGARALLSALAAFVRQGAKIELHAVGHSAGSIFLAQLVDAAHTLGLPAFKSVQFMAPALRVDTFRRLIEPRVGAGIDTLTVFTMRRDFERDDNCAGLYRKSLLYLVSGGCEPEHDAPLLGLEDSLRADPALRALFSLGTPGGGKCEVVWSKSTLDQGRSATRAVRHGDFDNDAPTMNAVLRRVLDIADTVPLVRPFPASRAPFDPWQDGVDWPPELLAGGVSATAVGLPASAQVPAPVAPAAEVGRRLALCVGIDAYPAAPLAGCRNDARLWQQTLRTLGFEAEALFDPTRSQLVAAIEHLFSRARAGDQIVLQYAGHGTHVEDLDGDDSGGDTPGRDEALCPLDFSDGALLIDDDLGALIDSLDSRARLTLFMDCCHSGDNTRFGGQRQRARADARARYMPPTPQLLQAHRQWRSAHGGTRAAARAAHPELLFTACRSDQLAWESGGHGEFTLRATQVLGNGGGPLSARTLHQRVVEAFGPNPRQQPLLDGPADRLDVLLFGR